MHISMLKIKSDEKEMSFTEHRRVASLWVKTPNFKMLQVFLQETARAVSRDYAREVSPSWLKDLLLTVDGDPESDAKLAGRLWDVTELCVSHDASEMVVDVRFQIRPVPRVVVRAAPRAFTLQGDIVTHGEVISVIDGPYISDLVHAIRGHVGMLATYLSLGHPGPATDSIVAGILNDGSIVHDSALWTRAAQVLISCYMHSLLNDDLLANMLHAVAMLPGRDT